MANNSDESDLDRISRLITEVGEQEFLLLGLDSDPSQANPGVESALLALREEKGLLEEELAEVWAKHCSKC